MREIPGAFFQVLFQVNDSVQGTALDVRLHLPAARAAILKSCHLLFTRLIPLGYHGMFKMSSMGLSECTSVHVLSHMSVVVQGTALDVRVHLPAARATMLKGCHLLFTRLIPLGYHGMFKMSSMGLSECTSVHVLSHMSVVVQGTALDVRLHLPAARATMLKGCHLLFTRLIPLGYHGMFKMSSMGLSECTSVHVLSHMSVVVQGTALDVRLHLPAARATMLKGCHLLFTRLIPLGYHGMFKMSSMGLSECTSVHVLSHMSVVVQGTALDVRLHLPAARATMLKGCHLLFTRLIPLGYHGMFKMSSMGLSECTSVHVLSHMSVVVQGTALDVRLHLPAARATMLKGCHLLFTHFISLGLSEHRVRKHSGAVFT